MEANGILQATQTQWHDHLQLNATHPDILALLVDQVQQTCCPLFAKAMGKFNTRRVYWHHIRCCFESFQLNTRVCLYEAIIGGMTRGQSVGKLFMGNIIALILGLVAFFLLETLLGGAVNLFEFCVVTAFAAWGGATAAAMTAWGE